ncbi:MAG: c-type cytochrome [Anaerolineae bacterium]
MVRPTRLLTLIQHTFAQAVLVLLGAFVIFRFGIRPPIPASLLWFYMAITLGVVLIYVSFDDESWQQFRSPILTLLLERESRRVILSRRVFLVVIPLLAGYMALTRITPRVQAPAELRAIHPAPPSSIQFRGETLEIQGLDNPFWSGPPERPDPALVREGGEIYSAHCVLCHGDALDGKGLFAQGVNPAPADFTDTGTIAQLQQSYLFWRIAKGGPGLPSESAPWNSAMPAWEDELSEDEIWKVIIYLYEAAGPSVNPRTWE